MNPARDQMQQSARRVLANAARSLAARQDASKLRKICLLTTPRTGSNALCDVMTAAGLGWPSEWLNENQIELLHKAAGWTTVRMRDYLSTVVHGTANFETGVFSIKVMSHQHENAKKLGVDILSLDFDVIVYLRRGDLVAQAYSYAKAIRSNIWTSEQDDVAKREGLNIDRSPVTRDELQEVIDMLKQQTTDLETALADRPHIRLTYEDLSSGGFAAPVRQMANSLDLDVEIAQEQPRLRRQSGSSDGEALAALRPLVKV